MRIGVNVSFLRKIDSGTGQVTVNFLRELIRKEKTKKKNQRHFFFFYAEEDFSWKDLGLEKKEEIHPFFQKRIFLPVYKRDDLVRKIWWEKWWLKKKVKEDQCEIFFSLYQSATIFSNGRIKHLMLVHDTIWKIFPQYLNNWRKRIYYFFVEKAILKADKILTVSQSSKQDIMEWFGIKNEKIQVALIDCDEIFKKTIADEVRDMRILLNYGVKNKDFIFYVGGFDQRKNVGFLLESYGQFWEKYRKMKEKKAFPFPDLVLAGKFNFNLVPLVENLPEKIDWVVKKYRLEKKKIKMIGFVKQEDLPSFYFQAGLFCFPSLYEGFGLPPLEAFNCGCPVLMNRTSSLAEIAGEKEEISFSLMNQEILAQKMLEVYADEKKRAVLINKGKEIAKKFSWNNFFQVVEKEWLK